jgi:hypothetical protein
MLYFLIDFLELDTQFLTFIYLNCRISRYRVKSPEPESSSFEFKYALKKLEFWDHFENFVFLQNWTQTNHWTSND